MERHYTRLYVDSAMSLSQLLEVAARAVGGTLDADTVIAGDVQIDVRMNDDFDRHAVNIDPTDFIHYVYSIEIEEDSRVALESYLELVRKVMCAIQTGRSNVVAACDWEDELPGAGKLGPAFSRS